MTRGRITLSMQDLRAVAGYAARCARAALLIFERAWPEDQRPRRTIEAALAFARGARRSKALRDAAWAAHRAAQEARDAGDLAASEVARAALAAAGAAFLHPLANATQVRHILGAPAHAARAFELAAGGDSAVGERRIRLAARTAPRSVVNVLNRYPPAPPGGGRTGELLRQLDVALRAGGGKK